MNPSNLFAALLCGLALPLAGQEHLSRPAHGPWNNDVLIYAVPSNGEPRKLATFERAGVPTLVRLSDGRLIAAFQHFPENDPQNFDRIATAFSSDEGVTWTKPAAIAVEGMDEGLMRPFDPTLVPLPDGRIRLYFTSKRTELRGGVPAIYSAISQDGLRYTFEPGVRFAIEGRIVIDCAVALHDGVFHLYSPDNGTGAQPGAPEQRPPSPSGTGYHATSTDGLTFSRATDVTLSGEGHWLGNTVSHEGKLQFFGTGGPGGIWTATSQDGATWEVPTRIPIQGADPGASLAKDGGWIFAVTGPPVRGERRSGPQGTPLPLNPPPFTRPRV